MKRTTVGILLCLLAGFSGLLAMPSQAETVLVQWTFPETNTVASAGLPLNTNQHISVGGGAVISSFVQGTVDAFAVNATSWQDGANTKYWLVSFSTEGYTNLTFSSRQGGSGFGPRHFKVQYRVGNGAWGDVPGAEMELTSTSSWVPGTLSDIALPVDADDQESVSLRWLMTSNTSINEGTVESGGTSRIDYIFVRGTLMPQPQPDAPVALAATEITGTNFVANWTTVPGLLMGYELDVATSDAFRAGGETVLVDFEGTGETKGTYAPATVALSGLEWNLTEALIGVDEADWKDGSRSLRLRGYGTSAMTLLEALPGGVSQVSFSYRRYGTDTQVDWRVEYTTNDVDWVQIGSDFTAPATDEVQHFSEQVVIEDPVRVRIKRATETGASNRRLNVDNIMLIPYRDLTESDFLEGFHPVATTETSVMVGGLKPGRYYYRVRAVGYGEGNLSENSNVRSVIVRDGQPSVFFLF